jgi:2-haloacid dehalogenase
VHAVAFDAVGTLFDLAPVRARLGESALEAWMERILHSAASLTLAGVFVPFDELAASTLPTTAAMLHLELDEEDVLRALAELPAKPDARAALERVHELGGRTAVLTNGTRRYVENLLRLSDLTALVDCVVSVEDVRRYKPHPAVYLKTAEVLGLPPEHVRLVSAHGWDVVGAREVGLPAVWVNREEQIWPFPHRAGRLPDAPDLVAALSV